VSFAAVTLCVASQRVFIVVVCFVIDSVRKLLDTPSYMYKTTVLSVVLYGCETSSLTLQDVHAEENIRT
jgi:hypothetical protein